MRTFRTLEKPVRRHSSAPYVNATNALRPGKCWNHVNAYSTELQHKASFYHVLTKPNLRVGELAPKHRCLDNGRGDAITKELGRRGLSSRSKPSSPDRNKGSQTVRIESPFRLTKVHNLPPEDNVDTVTLKDLIGDPGIFECWSFNHHHRVAFLMNHLHPDAQAMAKVHIIHGFTDPQDSNLTRLERQAARYKNVKLHLAFMPEPFLSGHHSKMLILFRYNGTAQVIIHTANMTENDWNNKTNGVWVSPLLPRMSYKDNHKVSHIGEIGSGSRFKHDLVNYLNSYNARWDVCNNMIRHLREFDFSPIRAALIASVPGRRLVEEDLSSLETQWGMEALKKTLEVVPVQNIRKSEVVTQVTSMAPIGATTRWLNRFFDAVSRARPPPIVPRSLLPRPYNPLQPFKLWKPWQKIIFPSDDEIRLSLDGYQAGTSIITKTKTHQGMKQYEYLKGYLNHWRNDSELGFLRRPREEVEQEKIAVSAPIISNKDAGRQRAVPNLATYIRYSNGTRAARPAIDWALLTSANLSVQSWGEAPNKSNRVRISSWELGVMVWPDLFAPDAAATKSASGDGSEPRGKVRMVATFKTDLPEEEEKDEEKEYEEEEEEDDDDEYKEKEEEEKKGVDSGDGGPGSKGVLVGIRLPYSLPLMQYADGEIPWTRDQDYPEPDVFGNVWLNGESVSDTSGKALDEGSERKPYPKPGQQLDPGAKAVYQGPEGLEKHVVARGWLF